MKYNELIDNGWIDLQQFFAGLSILAKGKDRILFNKVDDVIHFEYEVLPTNR